VYIQFSKEYTTLKTKPLSEVGNHCGYVLNTMFAQVLQLYTPNL